MPCRLKPAPNQPFWRSKLIIMLFLIFVFSIDKAPVAIGPVCVFVIHYYCYSVVINLITSKYGLPGIWKVVEIKIFFKNKFIECKLVFFNQDYLVRISTYSLTCNN